MFVLDIAAVALFLAGIVVLMIAAVFFVEVVAACFPSKPSDAQILSKPRLAVLIPAHDEALVLAETVRSILPQLTPTDRLLVVADNCSDATAAIATSLGVEVCIRVDSVRKGKSFALDAGVRRLSQDPPDVVVVVDADCKVSADCLQIIGAAAFETGRPAQAAYELLASGKDPTSYLVVAAFAAKVKNCVRPLGLHRLHLPCQLAGSGMAFPWPVIGHLDLASNELAEDLVLGLELARAGFAPRFCPSARVTSPLPTSSEGQRTQRARWEAGHLTTIFRRVPGLVAEGASKRNLLLLALAMDAAVPPLSLHALVTCILLVGSVTVALCGGSLAPLVVNALAAACLVLAIVSAWLRVGRDSIAFIDLAGASAYALAKIPLYAQMMIGKHVPWTRTKRD